MKHHQKIKKLGRKSGPRRALLRSLMVALIDKGRIKTTEARAKALRPTIEKLITLAQKDTLASRRLIIARLSNSQAAQKLIDEIASKYKNRPGGYTRIIKLPRRLNDASPMAFIEFV
jgi:large subunit ribosomal protein L17